MEPRDHATSAVWDEYWKSAWEARAEAAARVRAALTGSPWWLKIRAEVEAACGRLAGLDTIEIGAGAGEHSAKLALSGARTTLLDYSEDGLRLSQALFAGLGLEARHLLADAFALPPELAGSFDVAMSFGLVEHFLMPRRQELFRVHASLLKPGGLAIISSPNAWCLPYRIEKAVREWTGTWRYGLEVPFSPPELAARARAAGLEVVSVWGWSFWGAIEEHLLQRARLLLLNLWYNHSIRRLGRVYPPRRFLHVGPSRLDPWFGDHLTLFARKRQDAGAAGKP